MSSSQLQFWPQPSSLPRLRWSVSRDRRRRDCLRKYYLYHHASLGGQKAQAGSDLHELFVLKHLRNRFMWVGEIVHELIEYTLKDWRLGKSVEEASLIERGSRRMRQDWAASAQGLYRQNPQTVCGLVEHEYQEEVGKTEWQQMHAHMQRCIHNFWISPITQQLKVLPSWQWLALETAGSFELANATIVVKPDCAWRKIDGQVVILDWKTGAQHDEERWQMAVYGAYAQQVWGLCDTANAKSGYVQAQVMYLSDAQSNTWELQPQGLQQVQQDLLESVQQMQALEVQAHLGNVNLDSVFSKTTSLRTCSRCPFRRPCQRLS